MFNGVKVFSATMFEKRQLLGEAVTEWMQAHADCVVVELVVTQSSDDRFHCIAISVFYRQASTTSLPEAVREGIR
ncbi:MAG: hypothetical protein H0T42_30660 [Deltaproteobacteria bacterium]|nr:hypothetical protein [Deltaproteobacteria bacterium]